MLQRSMYVECKRKDSAKAHQTLRRVDMAKTNDFTKMMQDMMASFPVDTAAMQEAFKTQAALAEKMSKVALEAAEKSTEITAKWTKDTIAKMGAMTKAKAEAADYSKAATDFASSAAEMAAENMAAFRRSGEEGPDGNRRTDAGCRQGHLGRRDRRRQEGDRRSDHRCQESRNRGEVISGPPLLPSP
jgi:hypothetical protein